MLSNHRAQADARVTTTHGRWQLQTVHGWVVWICGRQSVCLVLPSFHGALRAPFHQPKGPPHALPIHPFLVLAVHRSGVHFHAAFETREDALDHLTEELPGRDDVGLAFIVQATDFAVYKE